MSGAVDSSLGPTLPALIRRLWSRAGRAGRAGLLALALIVGVALGALVAGRIDRASYEYDGPRAPAFELDHDGLGQVEPRGRELARFEHRNGGRLEQSMVVSPLRFPASPNPVATALPLAAAPLAAREARLPGYRQVLEGRTKLEIMEGQQAYMVAFTAQPPGGSEARSRLLGKLLLVPGPGERPHGGVVIELLQVSDDERVLEAARRYPSAFFLNWPVNFWLDLAVSVRVPGALGGALDTFAYL
jgi:hypothetical protein